MFDTLRLNRPKLFVFLIIATFVVSLLPLPRTGNAYVARSAGSTNDSKAIPTKPLAVASSAVTPQSGITYDLCLQNDSAGGGTLSLNTTTGDYIFTCGNCVKKTGRGTLTGNGCSITLQHNQPEYRVTAFIDKCGRTGTGSLQSPPGTTQCTFRDSNKAAEACLTELAPPQVEVKAPNGGEIVDAGSSFTITWTAADETGVVTQDVLLSTDGGVSFSPIITGLDGSINQYTWIAPLIANNQSLRVRVTARDAACNVGQDDGDANFTLWNPGGPLPRVAEAPLYMVSGGFNSIIHLCTHSAGPVTAEIGIRNRFGTALVSPPVHLTLMPDRPNAIDLSNYLTPQPSSVPGDPNILMGSIRLRHNGAEDNEVRGLLVVDQFAEEQSFTVPFIYLTSTQSPTSTMQCAPLYYVDHDTNAYLSLQNVTNSPVPVNVTLHYGTGAPGTPNGNFLLPQLTLAPQQTLITDLADFADELEGTHWGSIQVNAPAQTVAAHAVMMSQSNHLAFNSGFVDPAMRRSASKVASTLKLDYNMGLKACMMICNTSGAESRVVTASFQTDNGVVIPSRQVTLGPGQQSMIELDSRQLLSFGASTMANVRLDYSGNASDIVGGAVSMAKDARCAIPAQFAESGWSNGRLLVAPFFRFDARTSGILQLSNIGSSPVKAGAMMEFADTTLPGLNTELITIPAGGTATLDLRNYLNLVDDSVSAQGCLEVLHNGAPGTVIGSFTALGVHNDISLQVALEEGPHFNGNDMEVFPNAQELQPGDSSEVAVMTGGSLGQPSWSVSSTAGKPGTVAPLPPTDATVFRASYVSTTDPNTVAVKVRADATSSGGPVKEASITLEKVKVNGFTTSFGGRMRPEGGTSFTITGKKDWPDAGLSVKFKQGDLSTAEVSASRAADPKVLVGTAPANSVFIGDCQVIVLQGGTKISKDNSGAAYYAYDPPSPPTSISVPGFNRLGGNLTINSQGGGFRQAVVGGKTINPKVEIGQIDFAVNTVSNNAINGNVLRAPATIECCSCVSEVPCKNIRVTNPGGRKNDRVSSPVPLYNLLAGPPPLPQSRFPDFGFSIGGSEVTIRGENLDFVDDITIGGTRALIVSKRNGVIVLVTPPHTAGQSAIILFDIDNAAPGGTTLPGGGFRYDPTPVMALGVPNQDIFFVGPGEGVDSPQNLISVSQNLSCIVAPGSPSTSVTQISPPPVLNAGVAAFRVTGQYGCNLCTCSLQNLPCPKDVAGTITFRLVNTSAPGDTRLRRIVDRNISVHFTSPPPARQCSGSF